MKNLLIITALFLGACGPYQQPGAPGLNGSSCTTVTLQATTTAPAGVEILCTDGTSSFVASGSNGAPGTVVAPVQFCPGVQTTYPSTFAEIGFCIDNNLYAVYSINEGFLTLIPPGAYASNAVGSTCNFTVLPNCKIQ